VEARWFRQPPLWTRSTDRSVVAGLDPDITPLI